MASRHQCPGILDRRQKSGLIRGTQIESVANLSLKWLTSVHTDRGQGPSSRPAAASRSNMSAALLPGTKLGRYEIHSPRGAGGLGEVYLAQDTSLDRKVALKVLPENVASNRNRMQRFVQEAKAASALNHPNIITIYEIGTEPTSVRTYHSLRQKSRARVLSCSASNTSRRLCPRTGQLTSRCRLAKPEAHAE